MNLAARTVDPGSDAAIAASITPRPIEEIGAALGIPASALYRYGPYKAKIALDFARNAEAHPKGKLILVTAINPTPAGEGKTTTTIGLGDALKAAGKRVAIALREPSLGPVFGSKGGATGGGHAQIVPMQEINLHFTGDLHAITSAHNLLAAAIDNHIYWGNALDIDVRRISWRRVVDLNDRALRHVTDRPRRRRQRLSARGRLRHHGRQRSDGDLLPRPLAGQSRGAARAHGGGADKGVANPSPPASSTSPARWSRCCATRSSPTWCRRWRARRPWSMAGRSPISPMAAIR